jgi:ABC-type uncharacterized transport system permease subunit
MHGLLLKLALGLYSVGLLHSVLTVLRKKQTLFAPALIATAAGFLCHAASITLGAYEIQILARWGWHESFSLFAAAAVLAFLIVYWKYRIATLGVFAFPAIFVMTFIAELAYEPTASLSARPQSAWIYVHIALVVLGYVAFFIAFSAAVLYLIQERELKSKRTFYSRLPSLEICDDLAYRALAIGFPLMTLGMLSGALWAQQIQGDVSWMSDPKILLTFFTWLIYLVLIHYRLIAGWRGKKAAYMAIAGFVGVVVMFSFSGIPTSFHP